jgi:hypothetical protein
VATIILHSFPDMGCYAEHDSGACFTLVDGSISWPEWPDECACGAELPDVCEGTCPDCGEPYWQLIAESCSECGEYIEHDDTYWLCLDGGETYCRDCISVE